MLKDMRCIVDALAALLMLKESCCIVDALAA